MHRPPHRRYHYGADVTHFLEHDSLFEALLHALIAQEAVEVLWVARKFVVLGPVLLDTQDRVEHVCAWPVVVEVGFRMSNY